MPELRLYDTHSHILPGIDDGCGTVGESLGVLNECRRQGIGYIAATPHYYSRESVAEFLDKRSAAYEELRAAMDPNENWPLICLGAEVSYHAGLIYEERLRDLCYQGTSCLLLEMPFGVWTPNMLRDVEKLMPLHGITPVIAHFERYMDRQNSSMIERLLELELPLQFNAGFILDCRPAFKVRRMLRSGQISFLGSDCHNLDLRPQNLGVAADRILSWGMGEELAEICSNSAFLFRPDPRR